MVCIGKWLVSKCVREEDMIDVYRLLLFLSTRYAVLLMTCTLSATASRKREKKTRHGWHDAECAPPFCFLLENSGEEKWIDIHSSTQICASSSCTSVHYAFEISTAPREANSTDISHALFDGKERKTKIVELFLTRIGLLSRSNRLASVWHARFRHGKSDYLNWIDWNRS